MESLQRVWSSLKTWHGIRIGPIRLVYRFARAVKVSSNTRRNRGARSGAQSGRIDLGPPHDHAPSALAQRSTPLDTEVETALVVGVGPGLGHALVRTLSTAGMKVALAARDADRLDPLAREVGTCAEQPVKAYGCDATDEKSVREFFSLASQELGPPHLVVYAVQAFIPGRTLDVEVAAFEESWRANCLGAFIVARQAGRAMVPLGRGTIVLVGSTSGMIGREDHLNLAVGKFGLRALAQVMARELGPLGVHVLHCVVDADISETPNAQAGFPQARPQAIASLIHTLHKQEPSCWTSEIDVRPANEKFWVHC